MAKAKKLNIKLIKPQVIKPAEYQVEIDKALLIQTLKESGRLPHDAEIIYAQIHIPGGGDYSDTDLDLNDVPVKILFLSPGMDGSKKVSG
jgi:hypothetical protein